MKKRKRKASKTLRLELAVELPGYRPVQALRTYAPRTTEAAGLWGQKAFGPVLKVFDNIPAAGLLIVSGGFFSSSAIKASNRHIT